MVQFPEVEVFGVKLVNNRATKAIVEFTNNEDAPVQVSVIGGQLSSLKPLAAGASANTAIVRNLTNTRYEVAIPAKEKKQLTYSFTTDLSPQDLELTLTAILTGGAAKEQYQIRAFKGKVGVVDAPSSIFDPQMYVPSELLSKSLLISPQHLPLPRPCLSLPRYPLLRLQDLDRGIVPTNQARWKGRRASQAFVCWNQEGC